MPKKKDIKSEVVKITNLSDKFSFQPKEKLSHSAKDVINSPEESIEKCEFGENSDDKNAKRCITENYLHTTNRSVSLKDKKTPVKIEYETENSADGSIKIKKMKWAPKDWEIVLSNIKKMRKGMDAPVDTMGCHMCHDETAEAKVQRYQTLISLMLSSQTKDQVTYAAMIRLKEHGLNIENILETDDKTLGTLIYPVGFWKRKVTFIKKATEMLKTTYNGDIPNSVEELCKLPGVGSKMAHLTMSVAWGIVAGIGVDTHVHRITNRLGWVQHETKKPEETRKALEDWLPKSQWYEVNHLMVGFGQTICKPVGPLCDKCLNRRICPFVTKNLKK